MVDALASGLPVAADHAQVLERLRQLTAWQQTQQERLRRHQREQIARLREPGETRLEQVCTADPTPRSQPQSLASLQSLPPSLGRTSPAPPHPSSRSPPQHSPPYTQPRSPRARSEADSGWTELQQTAPVWDGCTVYEQEGGATTAAPAGRGGEATSDSGLEMGGQGSEEETPQRELAGLGERETKESWELGSGPAAEASNRPIHPGVGEGDTFEALLERQLRLHPHQAEATSQGRRSLSGRPHPFLRRGEGLSRYHIQPRKPKNTGSKCSKTPPTAPVKSGTLHRAASQDVLAGQRRGGQRPAQSAAGSAPLTGLHGSMGALHQRASTPLLASRFSSDESFIVRGSQRVKEEEEELEEFELLEREAVDNASFFSQCSLARQALHEEGDGGTERVLAESELSLSPSPDLSRLPISSVRGEVDEARGGVEEVDRVEEGTDGQETLSQDLDKTLTPSRAEVGEKEGETGEAGQSLAAGVLFSDDEEWESFSHGSPPRHQGRRQSGREGLESENVSSKSPSPWSSPVKRELLDGGGRAVSSTPLLPVPQLQPQQPERQRRNHCQDQPAGSPSQPTAAGSTEPSAEWREGRLGSVSSLPPPPSALAAQLFPALRQERERVLHEQRQYSLPQPAGDKTTPTIQPSETTPTTQPSEPELRDKLSQLETEIERFRAMNARLEKQGREKEQSLEFLRGEIAEFQRQKKQEAEQFEQYRREETRKLRKERRVFETYIQECRAGQERKDREEMEALRNEVQRLQEELASREERWRAALTRQRLRAEALEGQNRELQSDLRVMEQERLVWWQRQLEQERSSKRTSPPQPDPVAAVPSPPDSVACTTNKPAQKPPHSNPYNLAPRRQASKGRPPAVGRTIQQRARERGEVGKEVAAEPKRTAVVRGGRTARHKKLPLPVELSEESEDEPLPQPARGSRAGRLGVFEIVEVMSRDLSPPQSDLSPHSSDSEGDALSDAGSEVSALAEEIVSQVLGAQGERVGDEDHPRVSKAAPKTTDGGEGVGGKDHPRVSKAAPKTTDSGLTTGNPSAIRSVRFCLEASHSRGRGEDIAVTPQLEQEDGSRVVVCANGTKKVVSADGKSVTLHFFNGDTKHIHQDKSVVYYYCHSQTTHTTYPDGMEELHFPNQQTEKLFPDGRKEVRFPDGTVKRVQLGGEEESVFPDGTVQRLLANGDMVIEYTNGQRECHTADYKRRHYPDGTMKTVYQDGRQETRYASGRLRVKDSAGHVLVDTWQQQQQQQQQQEQDSHS